jgi:hypothetical protein
MIEGIKILIMRIIVSLCIVIGAMPLYRFIYAFAEGTDPSYCIESLYTVNSGVNLIYPIAMIGIAIAVFHIYYRCVRKRVYESTYSETGYYDPYSKT